MKHKPASVRRLLGQYGVILMLCTGMMMERSAWSDEIVMHTGERFTSTKVWEEGESVHFFIEGLQVKVNRVDVASMTTSQPRLNGATPLPDKALPSDGLIESSPKAVSINASAPTIPASNSTHQAFVPSSIGLGLDHISWQMAPVDIPGLVPLKSDPAFGGIDMYWQPHRPLKLGSIVLDGWALGFWRDQLYSVTLWTQGVNAYEALRHELFAHFGPGKWINTPKGCYLWDEHDSQRMLLHDAQTLTTIFICRSTLLDSHIKQLYPVE